MDNRLRDYFSTISAVTPPPFSEIDIKRRITQEDAKKNSGLVFAAVSLALVMLLATGVFLLAMFPTVSMLMISAIITIVIPFSAAGIICFLLYKKERVFA